MFDRSVRLAIWLLCVIGVAAGIGTTASATGHGVALNAGRATVVPAARIGASLADLTRPDTGPVFVDAMKQATAWTSSSPLRTDDDGNVLALRAGQTADAAIFPNAGYPSGDYTLFYDGTGRIGVVGATIVASTPGRILEHVSARAGGVDVRIAATNPSDPIRNVRLILPGYAATYAAHPFLPAVVSALRAFGVLRFEKWSQVATDNAVETYPFRASTSRQTQASSLGVAPEYEIALANETGDDPWFVIPVGATNDYVLRLAQLARATLDPRLHPHFEFAGDATRPGTATYGFATIAGLAQNRGSDARSAALLWHTVRSIDVLDIVAHVYAGARTSAVRVIGVPSGNADAFAVRAAQGVLLAAARHADAADFGPASIGAASFAPLASLAQRAGLAVAATDFPATLPGLERWHAAGGTLAVVPSDASGSEWNAALAYVAHHPSPHVVPLGSAAYASAPESTTSSIFGLVPKIVASVATGPVVYAINAGGAATGSFVADADYSAGRTSVTTHAIDTSAVTSPAPQSVYQSSRLWKNLTYTIPGFTPGAPYDVRLHFAETFWTKAGARVFSIGINGTTVQSNFDIFAAAGGEYKAIVLTFPATANASGQIVVQFNATTDNAFVAGIEIDGTGGATPTPTPTTVPTVAPTTPPQSGGDVVAINAGGAAVGAFAADEDYNAGFTDHTTHAIDVSGVSNPPAAAVYQDARYSPSVTYTVPGLVAGQAYNVRLHFAELFFTAAGKRIFNVSINGTQVLSKFDMFAAAGAQYRAIAYTFPATASASGQIAIAFQATVNNAAIEAIEVQSPGATSLPTTTPTTTPTTKPTTAPTTTPTSPPTGGTELVDWPTYQFDSARDGFNPSTAAFTPANLPSLHKAWQVALTSGGAAQPIVATNVAGHAAVLVVGTGAAHEAGYDGMTGTKLWETTLGKQYDGACGNSGIAGTAQYDAALGAVFVASGNGLNPNHAIMYRLNVATGAITGQTDVTTLLTGETIFAHTSITFANGLMYMGTGSNCEAASWRGQVIAVDPSSMAVVGRFFTTYGHGGNWGGGGVWAWGGVSADPSGHIYFGSGNAETTNTLDSGTIEPPFVAAPTEYSAYAEHITETDGSLTNVLGSNYPGFNFAIGYADLDFTGTPVIYAPVGCNQLAATQGKGGTLVITDTTNLSATATQYDFSKPAATANYIGNPAYSPLTGLLYAPISSSVDTIAPPGLAAIGSCGKSLVWHAQFGPDSFGWTGSTPRSAPTVTAGGTVFIATPCTNDGNGGCGTPGARNGAIWAIDASSGAVLGGGKPILETPSTVRMAPTIDGQWMWILDQAGNMYGMTLDAQVPALRGARTEAHHAETFVWTPKD